MSLPEEGKHNLVKPGLTVYLESCPKVKIPKTMTPGDLKNEVMTPKSLYVIDIALKLQICEFGKPRPDGFPGILSTS